MPTGYTDKIENGQTFEEFVWGCARAFSALASMRDEPDATIPDKLEPDSYHTTKVLNKKHRLELLGEIDSIEATRKANIDYETKLNMYNAQITRQLNLKFRYQEMLNRVQIWEVPSPDFQGLKDFMLEQIQISMRSDCYITNVPTRLTGEEWVKKERESTLHSIIYHETEAVKERERVDRHNRWLQQLRASVPPPSRRIGD